MAEEEKKDEKPARKSRREVMYDKKPAAKVDGPKEEKSEPKAEAKAEGDEGGGGGQHAEMFRRHANERRDMHGRHRAEHRQIEAGDGKNLHHAKLSAHRRHEREHADMHQRHEAEIAGATGAAAPMTGGGEMGAGGPAEGAG